MTLIDGHEDNDLDEYGGDVGAESADGLGYIDVAKTQSNTVYDGSYALQMSVGDDESGEYVITSTSGLNYYPDPGDVFHAYLYKGGGPDDPSLMFGVQSETNDPEAYQVELYSTGTNIRHRNGSDGSTTTDATIPSGEWLRVRVEWGTDGTITVDVYDSSGTNIEQVSVSGFSSLTTGGIGWAINGSTNATNHIYADLCETVALPPSAPQNVALAVDSDEQGTVSWDEPSDWGGDRGNYRIHISRDGTNYQGPAGGPTTVNDDGSASYSASYNPSSDSAYQAQFGIDSSFRFRVRAENSAGESGWSYSSTKRTTPIPPHAPSINRPDGDTVEITATMQTDIADKVVVQYREDTGSGYGSWAWFDTWHSGDGHVSGDPSNTGATVTATYSVGTSYQAGVAMSEDARYQFRLRTRSPSGEDSEHVSADYGNANNVYFSDDFESGDLSAWDTTSLSDADSGVTTNGHPDGPGGPAEGSYSLRLDAMDYVQQNLGDLSSESDVVVRCFLSVGSMDYSGEGFAIHWYDGASWQRLHSLQWEYNRQGWVQVVARVPDSYLASDNRVRFRGCDSLGGADHAGVDDVVVSDVLHEYTTPSDPSNLSLDASVEDEITASWSNNDSFGYPTTWRNTSLDGTLANGDEHASGTTSRTDVGLSDGERYEYILEARVKQYRRGGVGTRHRSNGQVSAQATTVLPAPTNFSVGAIAAGSADVSWTDNHDYGDVRLEIKRSSSSSWASDGSVSRNTETYTYSGLLNGEQYDVRAVAQTEHTETVDQ